MSAPNADVVGQVLLDLFEFFSEFNDGPDALFGEFAQVSQEGNRLTVIHEDGSAGVSVEVRGIPYPSHNGSLGGTVTGAALERFEPTGVQLVDEAVLYWGRATLCPTAYRIGQRDDGGTDWPNLVIASASLYALEIPPIRNLPDTYVVHGRFGMMHALQTALAQREGVDIEIVEANVERATVRITRPGESRHQGHLVTVTMEEARRAGWFDRNPCYRTMGGRMLAARATTAAIDYYAPGVLRGIASRVQPVAALDLDGLHVEGTPPAREGVGNTAPAPALAGYMTRPAPDDLYAEVVARLERLRQIDAVAYAELRAEWKALRGPVIQVAPGAPTLALLPDVLVLRYMLEEAEVELSGVAVHDMGPTPDTVYDDAPESEGTEPDDVPEYADDPDGRPFI